MSEDVTIRAGDAPDWVAAEELLASTPLVAEAVMLPLGPGLRPWLVARPDERELREGLFVNVREAIRFRLETSALRLPVPMRHVGLTLARESLPRRADGSPDRDALREAIGHPPAHVWPREPAVRTPLEPRWVSFLRGFPAVGGFREQLAQEHSLELDLGLDSLDRMELIVAAGHALGASVTDETLTSIYTLGDLQREIGPLPEGSASLAAPDAGLVLRPREGRGVPGRWLRPGGMAWPLVRLSRVVGRPLARRVLDLRVNGLEAIDWNERPLLISQNHQTHMDAVLLAAVMPPEVHRQLLFLGFTGYFEKGWGAVLGRIYRIFPISADAMALDGLRAGVAAVDAGRILCIYPEGERTWDGSIRPFRRGVAWIARETGARVVPAAVSGAYQAWPRGRKFAAHPVTISFGSPIDPPAAGSGPDEESRYLLELREATARLMREAGYDPDIGDPEVWAHGPEAALARRSATAVRSAR